MCSKLEETQIELEDINSDDPDDWSIITLPQSRQFLFELVTIPF